MPGSPPTAQGRSQTSRGITFILGSILVFTVMDSLAKFLLQHYGIVQVVWARYTGQTVIVFLFLAPRLLPLMRTKHVGTHALRSVFQLGATAFFFSGLAYIGLAEATAIIGVNPVLITLGAALFLGEKLGPRRLFGVLAAMLGAMIIIRPGTGVFTPAALLPLAGAVCYASFALLTRKVGPAESSWTSLIYAALTGTVVTSIAVVFHWQPIALVHVPGFLVIGIMGAVAQLWMIRAFSTVEASVIAPFGYVGLLFATFWGYVLFSEIPDIWTGVGALVIVAAGLYVWHRETRAARADVTPDK